MNPFSCILIGNESLTRECGAALMARGHRVAALVTRNPEVAGWARGQGLPVIAQEKGWEAQVPAVDWLLSVANLSLVPEAALARAAKGGVNFHDGPLPRHAGLNAPVWAILQGDADHGITWHRITAGVDEGPILAQAAVENSAKARNDDYNAAEKIIMVKAPIAPIYQYTNGRLIKPWLKGYPITNPEDVAYSRTMYIVKH